ncbi:formate dehydrogenase major subunit [Marmoricola bigeumensis]|uniref:Formate dehydrogenase major subunit n=2 Tax=Nocardioides marmoribigeumensis TaxID=433649 RepID=A0ABU2BYC7_9ACTN|nr:formate dehydrogenase major subunit [Nocardioides marmoribigeumensis]
MAEAHPVGFQWVMEAKRRGATIIHVDPRFTRTSAVADIHAPIRAGSDIAFLGALVNHVLSNDLDFREYVVAYTNAASIIEEGFQDTEDLDGLFSGFDPESGQYDPGTWQYVGATSAPAAGQRDPAQPAGDAGSHGQQHEAARSETHGSGGPGVASKGERDETLQHPRCVFQILKRHFARYTPEMVQEVCGISPDQFARIADALTSNSGRERTSAICYAVGWTHHSVGAQMIRTSAILQTLLGNIGRPGGGIMALRGHASIQGSTDIPTLFNILPGYLPMPHAAEHQDLAAYVAGDAGKTGFWGNMSAYAVSLLKSYWGDAATPDNEFCFDYLPRLTGDASTYTTVKAQIDGRSKGYFIVGENPAVGSANGKMQRLGLANLDWLVVRDLQMIESATFWKDGPEIETGELVTEEIGTEVFFLPAATHVEKAGSFTQTQRMLQWRDKAVDPPGDCRSELDFYYELGVRIREKLKDSTDEMDRPLLDLAWDYPVDEHGDVDGEAVLMEINGTDAQGNPLSGYTELKDDGSTACGCWIYSGVYADGVNQARRRKPHWEQDWVASEWGWAWPANRRQLYNRASAAPDGTPWSERKRYITWDADQGKWVGPDVPDFIADRDPSYVPPDDAKGPDAIGGADPFIMQTDGKAWLFAPLGVADGPLPAHYEPPESPVRNPLYGQQNNPGRQGISDPSNPINPSCSDVFPYVFTSYRLTEHHTAGGMSRTLPYLTELQPEPFCEVSPRLARERGLEHGEWATIVTARSAIEARVLVTDRLRSLRLGDQWVEQVGLPYHWGRNGISQGDSPNDLVNVTMDPNVYIQDKVGTCDIRPGRRPRGPALTAYVEDYRRRAGVSDAPDHTDGGAQT